MSSIAQTDMLSKKTDLGLKEVTGTIQPCSRNQQRVCLVENEDEKEYCIIPKGAGADLVDFVSENMTLRGVVNEFNEDDETYYTIQVRSYKHED